MATSLEAPPQSQTTETAAVRPGIIIPVTRVPQESAECLKQRNEVERIVRGMTDHFAKRTYLRLISTDNVLTSARYDERSLLIGLSKYERELALEVLRVRIGQRAVAILDDVAAGMTVAG